MNHHSNKKSLVYIALLLVLMLAIGTSAALVQNDSAATAVTVSQSATVVQSPFTEAVQLVTNSVVSVNNYTMRAPRSQSIDPFAFGFGFGWGEDYDGSRRNRGDESGEPREVQQGAGSGVVIAAGYVLTNYHVIDGATRLEIAVDEETYDAVLVGSDEALDIAVLWVDKLPLSPVTLGDSDLLNVGDWAICIGNPLSFTRTATVGIVSALNREISNSTTDAYGLRKEIVNQMIQTDAAINSGNSGGGMFNVAGELVGVPSLKYSSSMFSGSSIEGIGMAIPINVAKPLIEEAVNGELPEGAEASTQNAAGITTGDTPRIGVSVSDLNTSNAAVAAGILPRGAYVSEVEAGSPAEKAGILPGDIVVEVDGTITSTTTQMVSILRAKQAGDIVNIKVYRIEGVDDLLGFEDIPEGEYIDISVELALLGNVKQ